jgi:hypothetical protein
MLWTGAIKRSLWLLGSSALLACSGPTDDHDGISLNGTYAGTASDNTGPGTLSWVLTQSGSKITGSVTLGAGNITGHGTVSGTLSGSTLTFTISIPAGGLPFPYASCVIAVSGTANNVTSSSINGTYSGNNSCTGSVSGGTFNLVRQ